MRINDVMDDVAARLRSVPGLNVWSYPAGSVTPPAAVVAYPDAYDPHSTYARGAVQLSLPVVVVSGKASERSARDLLSDLVDGSGGRSLIDILESGRYTAFDDLTVSNVEFDVVRVGGTDYEAAIFDCDIIGSGA